jgi:hypothetical protein
MNVFLSLWITSISFYGIFSASLQTFLKTRKPTFSGNDFFDAGGGRGEEDHQLWRCQNPLRS